MQFNNNLNWLQIKSTSSHSCNNCIISLKKLTYSLQNPEKKTIKRMCTRLIENLEQNAPVQTTPTDYQVTVIRYTTVRYNHIR